VLEDCLRYVEFAVPESPRPAGMFFLAAGPKAASSADLLSSPQAGRLLGRLATGADIVLIDSPPVLASADALAIGRLAAGAVLVVEAGQTTVPAVQRAKDALTRDQTRLLGVVLNRFEPAFAGSVYGDHVPDYGHGY
jgi:Mrp family chromosome partitioning ATPase